MQLRMIQEAVARLCEGFRFRGAARSIPQLWYCDDGAFMAPDLQTLQLVVDTCWMVTRAAGMRMQIKSDKKTAWQASYWADGEEHEVEGWTMRAPDGTIIPQVGKSYTYLGSEEPAIWEGAQEGVRRHVIRKCTNLMRMIGRVGGLGERQLRVALGLAVEGTIGFYGRATAIGWDACEKIEQVRAEVLRQRGYAGGRNRVQMYASRAAGGLDHRHAYQYAAAVLVDQVDRALDSAEGTPARVAVEAHMRATCVRWGWTGREHFREWLPTHAEHLLSEDAIGEAWLLARIRTGAVDVGGRGGENEHALEEGPPVWQEDEREEWRAHREPCRVRVGPRRDGGVGARVTPARSACEMTARSTRLCAAGVHTWADVTHATGRWLTWAEMRARYTTLRDGDREGYEEVVRELEAPRWEKVRARWWATTCTPRWREWQRRKARQYVGGGEGQPVAILGARRTAACLGGWEVRVDWGEGWAPTWVGEAHLTSGGWRPAWAREQIERAKAAAAPASLYERLTTPAGDGGGRREWSGCEVGRKKITGDEASMATAGDLHEPAAQRALAKLWQVFLTHAAEVSGGGGRAREMNVDERPGSQQETAPGARETHRTLYAGEGGKAEGGRRASLGESDGDDGLVGVTEASVEARVAMQRRLDAAGDGRQVLPHRPVHEYVRWRREDETAEYDVWGRDDFGSQIDAYAPIDQREWRDDAFMRMAMRSLSWETGAPAPSVVGDVELDAAERKVLDPDAAPAERRRAQRANRDAMVTAAALHLTYDFAEIWATDGAKKETRTVGGRTEVRVSCGAYEGAREVEERHGENDATEARRSVGAGIIGARLPASCEVLDAELCGMLLALRTSASRPGADGHTVLVMSDSLEALRLVERAWRHGVWWSGGGSGRAPLLHAINTERGKMRRVVTMWVPSHAGIAANAAADAAAKTYLGADETWELAGDLAARLPPGRAVRTVDGAPWFTERFAAVKDAVGWWVKRRHLSTQTENHGVDARRCGPKWEPRDATRLDVVWERTGARTTAPPTDARGEGHTRSRAESLVERAERETNERTERRNKRERNPRATAAQIWDDAERCGVAMAARDGQLWEGGTGASTQMCPACCTHRRGWRWIETADGTYGWRSMVAHLDPVRADLWHVLCGECDGVDDAVRHDARNEIRANMQRAQRELTRKMYAGRGKDRKEIPHYMTHGRTTLTGRIADAQKCLARGARATAQQKEGMRAWLAGELAHVGGDDRKRMRRAEQILADAVRKSQHAAARMRDAWRTAAAPEMKRRSEREGYAEGRVRKGVGMSRWRQAARAVDTHAREQLDGGQRHGWTVTGMLVQYMRRNAERREEARRATRRASDAHQDGAAVVASFRTVDMRGVRELAVVTLLRMHAAETPDDVRAHAETRTVWHPQVAHAPEGATMSTEEALRWLDTARAIRISVRSAEDARAWAKMYGDDEKRRAAHQAKTVDVGFATYRATGTPHALSAILRASGCRYREEEGGSAERWWRNGELEALAAASRSEARAIAQALVREDARAPGGQAVPGTTVRREVCRGVNRARATSAADTTATGGATPRAAASGSTPRGVDNGAGMGDDTRGSGAHRTQDATDDTPELLDAAQSARPKRAGSREIYYGTAKRQRRAVKIRYVDDDGRARAARDRIQVGAATIDRVAGGAYEWRDGGHRDKRRRLFADGARGRH